MPVTRFRAAAEQVMAESKIKDIKSRIHRVTKWAFPVIGNMPLDDIWPKDITKVRDGLVRNLPRGRRAERLHRVDLRTRSPLRQPKLACDFLDRRGCPSTEGTPEAPRIERH